LVHLGGADPLIVCQRGLLLLPNKACVLPAFGDRFNLYGIMDSGDGTRTFYKAPTVCLSCGALTGPELFPSYISNSGGKEPKSMCGVTLVLPRRVKNSEWFV
uniref:Uncharacterized protein n=1 Tax=Spermophilus dauricus TaxID=99837 RepID=A0A8C9PEI3_SPEDA